MCPLAAYNRRLIGAFHNLYPCILKINVQFVDPVDNSRQKRLKFALAASSTNIHLFHRGRNIG
jgi:hypothetical protein